MDNWNPNKDLGEWLGGIKVDAYGKTVAVRDIISVLTEEELTDIFQGTLESLLQEGRLPKDGSA